MPCAPSSSFRQSTPLFSKLRNLVPEDLVSDLALDDLAQAATKPKLKTAKSILVNQGDQAPNLVILGCPATVKSTGLSGRPTLLGFLGRGDAIVESMSENQISGATYQSLDDLACYHIPWDHVLVTADQHSGIYRWLLALQQEQLRMMAQLPDLLGYGEVEERLARLMLWLEPKFGLPDVRGRFIALKFTHLDIAGALGIRTETSTRHFTAWKKAGLVTKTREGFTIHNMNKLRLLAGSK